MIHLPTRIWYTHGTSLLGALPADRFLLVTLDPPRPTRRASRRRPPMEPPHSTCGVVLLRGVMALQVSHTRITTQDTTQGNIIMEDQLWG